MGSLFGAPKDALHVEIQQGHTGKVREMLLKNKSLVDARDRNNNVPLHFAVQTSSMELVRLLVTRGGDVNAQNNSGYAPLHLAVEKAHQEIARFLITNGAVIDIKDKEGRTPLDWADQLNHRGMAEFLRKQAGSGKSSS